MRNPSAVLSTLLLAGALCAPATGRAATRDLHTEVPVAGAESIRLVLPVGGIEVRGDGGTELRAELSLRCRRRADCDARMDDIHLDTSRRGDRLVFTVRGYPTLFNSDSLQLNGVIHVPAGLPLDVDMKVGDLRVSDVGSDVRVDMGVGEVKVNVAAAGIGRVHLDSGVGDATLRSPDGRLSARRSLLVGARLDWHAGRGPAVVDVDLGVGEVTVDLD